MSTSRLGRGELRKVVAREAPSFEFIGGSRVIHCFSERPVVFPRRYFEFLSDKEDDTVSIQIGITFELESGWEPATNWLGLSADIRHLILGAEFDLRKMWISVGGSGKARRDRWAEIMQELRECGEQYYPWGEKHLLEDPLLRKGRELGRVFQEERLGDCASLRAEWENFEAGDELTNPAFWELREELAGIPSHVIPKAEREEAVSSYAIALLLRDYEVFPTPAAAKGRCLDFGL